MGNNLMNVNLNLNLKFGDIFKIISCTATNYRGLHTDANVAIEKDILIKKGNHDFSISSPVFLHSIHCNVYVNENTSN